MEATKEIETPISLQGTTHAGGCNDNRALFRILPAGEGEVGRAFEGFKVASVSLRVGGDAAWRGRYRYYPKRVQDEPRSTIPPITARSEILDHILPVAFMMLDSDLKFPELFSK